MLKQVLLAALMLTTTAGAVANEAICSSDDWLLGGCVSGEVRTDEVVLEGVVSESGAYPDGTGEGGSGSGDSGYDFCVFYVNARCSVANLHGKPVAARPVTLADIAHFQPQPGTDHMEPNGWMVIGLPANFYADVDTQVVDGTLLGQSASVRFTPVAWNWKFSDGSTNRSTTPGEPWSTEFESTSTSHVFQSPGAHTIMLSIDFAAEYRFAGGDWVAIAGILSLPTNPLNATAGGAATVLVDRSCEVNPTGPGC